MGDALIFIAILFVFYIGECVHKFPKKNYLLQASPWWVPNPGQASEYFGTDTWGLFVINPFPPLASVFLVSDWPDPQKETSLKEALSEKRLDKVLDNYKKNTRWLRVFCNSLFWYIFLLVPAALWFLGGMYLLPAIGVLVVVFIFPICVFFFKSHRRLIEAGKEDIFNVIIPILLFPPATIRAADRISLQLLKGFHPLLLAHRFGTPAQFKRFAGPFLRDLKFPVFPESSSNDVGETVLPALSLFLKKHDMSLEEFLDPGSPENEESESYCPRCLEEYLLPEGACSDCPGVRLQPLK